jgi:hypothetical protein
MGGMKHWWKGLAGMLALAQPAVAAPTPPAASAAAPLPRPAIWLLEDEDTKIYLFGTVHIFPSSLQWRSAALDRVIGASDELVMETPEASSSEMGDGAAILARMRANSAAPILDRVSPAVRPQLQAAIEATGMPTAYFDELETWGAAVLLQGLQAYRQQGGEDISVTGSEEVLGSLFRASGRPIAGLETVEEQLGIFAALTPQAQSRFLEMTVSGASIVGMSEPEGNQRWASGDVDAIAAEARSIPPELHEPLLTRRNAKWTNWLVQRLSRPGTVLFAVGAGHLAGPDSVQQMLAERGLRVRRFD